MNEIRPNAGGNRSRVWFYLAIGAAVLGLAHSHGSSGSDRIFLGTDYSRTYEVVEDSPCYVSIDTFPVVAGPGEDIQHLAANSNWVDVKGLESYCLSEDVARTLKINGLPPDPILVEGQTYQVPLFATDRPDFFFNSPIKVVRAGRQ